MTRQRRLVAAAVAAAEQVAAARKRRRLRRRQRARDENRRKSKLKIQLARVEEQLGRTHTNVSGAIGPDAPARANHTLTDPAQGGHPSMERGGVERTLNSQHAPPADLESVDVSGAGAASARGRPEQQPQTRRQSRKRRNQRRAGRRNRRRGSRNASAHQPSSIRSLGRRGACQRCPCCKTWRQLRRGAGRDQRQTVDTVDNSRMDRSRVERTTFSTPAPPANLESRSSTVHGTTNGRPPPG